LANLLPTGLKTTGAFSSKDRQYLIILRLYARLQNNSYLYFHGHSVGGTNPSLLEAMASEALIAAHNNPFNKSVLNTDAFYFNNANDVRQLVENVQHHAPEKAMVKNNLHKIRYQFNWEKIIDEYEAFIIECYTHLNYEKIIPGGR
jgi:glycosyltransferase involved in cell wall biosynthesis